MRLLAVIGLGLCLAGCATTKPLSGADIEYRLPRTDAVASVTLTLKSCENFMVDGSISITPQAGPSNRGFKIPAASLASARIKRSLKITKNGNDVLIGINSGVADRTPQIAGNILKTVATLAPVLLSSTGAGNPVCKPLAKALTERSRKLTEQLEALSKPVDLAADGSAAGAKAKGDDLDALSKQLAAVKTALTITFNVQLELPDTPAAAATPQSALPTDPFDTWFRNPSKEQIGGLYSLEWSVTADPIVFAPIEDPRHPRKASRECGFKIPVPYARRVMITVVGKGEKVTDLRRSTTAFVGQWDSRDICIDVGFGETRTNELTFDDFGHVTSANWTSEARAETISGAIAGSAGDAANLIGTIARTTVKSQKAEIDELQTQQNYNKVKACEAVIKAGGTTCPSQ